MIEIKLSQGAKPGHGGMLLGAKVSPEIAQTRNVPLYKMLFHHISIQSSQPQVNYWASLKN